LRQFDPLGTSIPVVKTFQIPLMILNDLPAPNVPNCERQASFANGEARKNDHVRDVFGVTDSNLKISVFPGIA